MALLPLALLGSLGACAQGLQTMDTGLLPPPPKALTPIASLTKPDTLAAIAEEAKRRTTWQKVSDSTAESRTSALKWNTRFPGSPDFPGELSAGREASLLQEREAARQVTLVGWSAVDATEHSMLLYHAWGALRSALRTDQEVTVRRIVWPATVGVEPAPRQEQIRLASDWIPLRRIAGSELRCARIGTPLAASDSVPTPVVPVGGEPAVRLIAHIEAAERPRWSAITAGTEFRGVRSCQASTVWADRVAEFAFDAWMGANRAVQLGGMPLISR